MIGTWARESRGRASRDPALRQAQEGGQRPRDEGREIARARTRAERGSEWPPRRFRAGDCFLDEATSLEETVKRLAAWLILATVGVALAGCFVEEDRGGYGRGGYGGGYGGYNHHYYHNDYYR